VIARFPAARRLQGGAAPVAGLRTTVRSPDSPKCPSNPKCLFNASRGCRSNPGHGHRRDHASPDHHRGSGPHPDWNPNPGPRSRLGTMLGTARVGPGRR